MKYCVSCRKSYPTEYETCPKDDTRLQTVDDCRPGMVIRNKYEILDRIGIGGMATVYRARHVIFNELCAIKVVGNDLARDPNFLRRFEAEAVITRKLRHPSAVRVDDFDCTEDGRPFIVMELVEGRNVRNVVQEGGPLPWLRAVRIACQVAEALGVAHRLGIVHRDIKPDNIILARDAEGNEIAKVLDFGIAKLQEATEQVGANLTMTGLLIGTPRYMSPEQFLGNKTGGIDGRADIYSLGIVLFQMLTGQLPFDSDTPYGLMRAHIETPVSPPHLVRPDLNIPESVSAVVLKALEKDRDNRFQNAEEMAAALEAAANGIPQQSVSADLIPASDVETNPILPSVPAPTDVIPDPAPSPLWFRKPVSLMVTGITMILAVLGISGWLMYKKTEQARLEKRIWATLHSDASGVLHDPTSITIALRRHDVELAGNVADNDSLVKIESIIASVPGVTGIINKSTVLEPTASAGLADPHTSPTPVATPQPTPKADEAIAKPDVTGLLAQGQAALDDGNYKLAIKHFQAAVHADSSNGEAKKMMDRTMEAQRTEEALLRPRKNSSPPPPF